MIDTPLLVNIKGCGYPPEVACPRFASDYEALLNRSETFPCYYSRVNPWIVIEVSMTTLLQHSFAQPTINLYIFANQT